MGERRMFSKRIVESTRFLRIPATSQNLYFHLGMLADDDGIVEAYPVMCTTGASEDDLRVLVSKKFVTVLNQDTVATVYKGNIIKNLIMDCQSYTKYRPNETTGGIFVSWRRKEELPTGLD